MNLMAKRQFLKPFFFLLALMVLLEWSCFAFVSFYLVTIFQVLAAHQWIIISTRHLMWFMFHIQATKAPLDPYMTSVIVATARSAMAFVASPMYVRFKRRTLFLTNAVVTAAALFVFGGYCYLIHIGK